MSHKTSSDKATESGSHERATAMKKKRTSFGVGEWGKKTQTKEYSCQRPGHNKRQGKTKGKTKIHEVQPRTLHRSRPQKKHIGDI